jgi:hypothetical protein
MFSLGIGIIGSVLLGMLMIVVDVTSGAVALPDAACA